MIVPQSIIDRVQKLLNLADPKRGATPAEAAVAMEKAKKLLTEYELDVTKFNRENGHQAPKIVVNHETVCMDRKTRYDFENNVASILRNCFSVEVLFTTVWKKIETAKGVFSHVNCHAYIIVGESSDILLAKIAIPILIDAMFKGVRTYLKEERGGEKWTATVGRSFYDGITYGYIQGSEQGRKKAMAAAKKEDADAFALVVVDKKAIVKNYVQEEFKPRTIKNRSRYENDSHAFAHGVEKGKKLDLNGSSNKLC